MSEKSTLDDFGGEEGEEGDAVVFGSLQQLEKSPLSEWNLKKLGSILTLEYGDNLPSESREEGDIPVFGSNGQVGTHSEPAVNESGIILGRKGSIGEIKFSEEPFWPIDTTYYLTKKETNENLRFLYYLLQSIQLERLNAASAIPGLNRNDAYGLNALIPPLPEQQRIAAVLYTIDEVIEKTDKIIKQSNIVKKALMQKVFHGHHKDFDEYQTTSVGVIPTCWSVVSIGDVVRTAQYGISESLSEEGQYPIFRMNNIENGYMVDEPLKYIDLNDSEFQKYRVEKGDILFNRTNSLELVGKTGIYELNGDHVFASYLVRLQTNKRVDPYYLNYYMNSSEAQNRMMDFATKGVSQANINANSIQQVLLPLPSIEEQEEIVNRLGSIDSQININERYKSQLKRLKSGLMQDLLSGTVRTTDTNIEVPDKIAQYG